MIRVSGAGFLAMMAVLAFSTPALARDLGASTRALGMGDAVHSLGMGLTGLYFNPATLNQEARYEVSSGYGYTQAGRAHGVHVGILDSQTNEQLGGAVAYTYGWSRSNGRSLDIHDVRAALCTILGQESWHIAIGAGFRYLKMTDTNLSVSGPTMDGGILLALQNLLFLGVSGQNLIPLSTTQAPRLLGIGLSTAPSIVRVGVDAVVDFESQDEVMVSPSAGVEVVIQNMLAVRTGFSWDRSLDQKRLGAGIGYMHTIFGLDVAYAHDLSHLSDWQVQGTLRFFIPQ